MRYLLAWLLVCAQSAVAAAPEPEAATAQPAQVAVLATLHGMHAEVPGYADAELKTSILRLAPDVLCIEMSAQDHAQRRAGSVKVEYPAVVYPLIDARQYTVCTLEPSSPRAGTIIGPYQAANRAFHEDRPDEAAAFSAYMDALYAALRLHWRNPSRVNDAVTDDLMRAKHALQEAMIGEGERIGWGAWNQHFLDVIVRTASEHPGKRIVVLVGVEHGYWLRERLAGRDDIELLDTAALLMGDG